MSHFPNCKSTEPFLCAFLCCVAYVFPHCWVTDQYSHRVCLSAFDSVSYTCWKPRACWNFFYQKRLYTSTIVWCGVFIEGITEELWSLRQWMIERHEWLVPQSGQGWLNWHSQSRDETRCQSKGRRRHDCRPLRGELRKRRSSSSSYWQRVSNISLCSSSTVNHIASEFGWKKNPRSAPFHNVRKRVWGYRLNAVRYVDDLAGVESSNSKNIL